MSTAIEFNNISKLYRLGLVSTGTLSHDLKRWWTVNVRRREDPYMKIGEVNDRSSRGGSDYVWALKDIDFKVEQGDVVGIIGKNGAGKSTLLKILSRVTAPTTGSIRAKGRIGSLLEVGTGFHPEMTGRENIYMNGAILGMSKAEITRKLDEIIDFSGCERYIDTPVKRYSSGMMVRLGFAVAAHLDPEILVVDEVLAVGDAEFQKKAIGKMQDVSRGEGRTVLFVSHNMAAVRKLCRQGVVLDNGQMSYIGTAHDAVEKYMLDKNTYNSEVRTIVTPEMRDINRSLKVKFISIEHAKGDNTYAADEDIVLLIEVKSDKSVEHCRINCTIRTTDDLSICTNSSTKYFNIGQGESKRFRYTLHNPGLVVGNYLLSFSVGVGNAEEGETNFDVVTNATSINIDRPRKNEESYFLKWDTFSWGHILMENSLEELSSCDM
ncbi:MAG: ABC transporter ATP-binding protein [Bacteroidales bacterium]|nr:ABC transporter ATP-binding protein [Bacteroidales bacterium]